MKLTKMWRSGDPTPFHTSDPDKHTGPSASITMNFSAARKYYLIKHYRWAQNFLLSELREDFPRLRLVRNEPAENYLRFISSVPAKYREQYACSIQKRFHKVAIGELGEGISEQEKAYIDHFVADSRAHRILQPPQVRGRKLDRRLLRKTLRSYLAGIQGLDFEDLGGGGWMFYKKDSNVLIRTSVFTGSTLFDLTYSHALFVAAQHCLYEQVSILSWLGISWQTDWYDLSSDEMELRAANLCQLIRVFLDSAPEFVDDIEIEVPN